MRIWIHDNFVDHCIQVNVTFSLISEHAGSNVHKVLIPGTFAGKIFGCALSESYICSEVSVMTIEHYRASNNTMHSLLQVSPKFSRKDFAFETLDLHL